MKYVIRVNQTGWVVYPFANPDNFYVFRSDEPERFVRFIAEKLGHIKIDQLVDARVREREDAERKLGVYPTVTDGYL